MHLLTRHHEARTHRAALDATAIANSDATKRRFGEAAAFVRELKVRRRLRWVVVRAESKILIEPIGVHDLARVHLPIGIPDRFEFAERFDQFGTEHFW